MLSERVQTFEQHDVSIVVCKGIPYFRASDVAFALGYANSKQAVRKNVNEKYIRTLTELRSDASGGLVYSRDFTPEVAMGRPPLYISEPGVIELVWHSKKPEALRFRQWVLEEVLPEIRKNGSYVRHEQVSLMNETDLHYKVVDFVRKYFPEAILVAGLGELQDTDPKRLSAYRKGYTRGQPDILILNRTRKNSGLAIELKTPLGCGKTSPDQDAFLKALQQNKYETILSCIYDDIVVKIIEYREAARRCDPAFVCRVKKSLA
jgi:prophage antirepressor-like protein